MGSAFSLENTSQDGVWSSVAEHYLDSEECSKWDKLQISLFEDLNDEDMKNITSIMNAKKCVGEDRRFWCINNDIIKVKEVTWNSEEKKYSWVGLVKPEHREEWDELKRNGNDMKRLAIHIEALHDYKSKKKGESKGEIFDKISLEQSKIREENPVNDEI